MAKLIQYCTHASHYDGPFDATVGWAAAGLGYLIVYGSQVGVGTSGQRRGYMYAGVTADGNKYQVFMPGTNKGFGDDVWYSTTGLSQTKTTKTYVNDDGSTSTKTV